MSAIVRRIPVHGGVVVVTHDPEDIARRRARGDNRTSDVSAVYEPTSGTIVMRERNGAAAVLELSRELRRIADAVQREGEWMIHDRKVLKWKTVKPSSEERPVWVAGPYSLERADVGEGWIARKGSKVIGEGELISTVKDLCAEDLGAEPDGAP